VAEEGVNMVTTDGLGDGRETSGLGDLVVPGEFVPCDLQQLLLAFHMLVCGATGVCVLCLICLCVFLCCGLYFVCVIMTTERRD